MAGKRYLVTGGTSGIGKAICQRLAEEGHQLVLVVRDAARADTCGVVAEDVIVADFENPEACEKAFANYKGRLDGIVNAAGVLVGKSLTEMDFQQMQQTMNVNVLSPMVMLGALLPHLNEGAVVVLLGSISAHKGSYDDVYAASKGAIHSMVKSLALKLAPSGRVVGIAPGMTQGTRMTNELLPGRFEETLSQRIPMKQAGKPEDVAALVSFVLSDHANFMTGAIIDINGGQYLR